MADEEGQTKKRRHALASSTPERIGGSSRRCACHRRPPKFGDCGRIVKFSMYWKCYGTAPARMLGKKLGQDFSKNWLPKMYKKSINEQRKNQPKMEKIGVWRVFWEVWGPSWSHVEQAWQQKWKNARQKSPKMPNLVGIWRPSWGQNSQQNL